MIARRSVLLGFSALAPAAVLAGCANGLNFTKPTPAQVATDIALIAAAFVGALPRLSLPAAVMTVVANAANDIKAVSDAFAQADTEALAQPLVTRIGADINKVVDATTGFDLDPAVAAKIKAAQALLPIIEMAVGMVVPASATAGRMSAAEARATLAR